MCVDPNECLTEFEEVYEHYWGCGEEVGDSGSAQVLADPDDYTVVGRFSYGDKAYLDWATWITEQGAPDGYGGEHLLKIYALHINDNADSCAGSSSPDYYHNIVIMERLESLEWCEYEGLTCLFENEWNCDLLHAFGDGDFDKARAELCAAFELTNEETDMLTDDFLEFQSLVNCMAHDYGHNNDLHDYNVMVRRHECAPDVLVITDPWC